MKRADLLRVEGIDVPQADMLVRSGVSSITELANCDAQELDRQLSEMAQERQKTNLPERSQLECWIKQAKKLLLIYGEQAPGTVYDPIHGKVLYDSIINSDFYRDAVNLALIIGYTSDALPGEPGKGDLP